MGTVIGLKPGIKTIAAVHIQCLLRVIFSPKPSELQPISWPDGSKSGRKFNHLVYRNFGPGTQPSGMKQAAQLLAAFFLSL
jgi:hypothetical protein